METTTNETTTTNIPQAKTKNFVRVGKVKDGHGIRGELFIVLFAGEAEWVDEIETIRLVQENTGETKTLTAKSVRAHKNGLIAKTEELKSRNDAEALKGWLFEIPSDFLVSEAGEKIFLQEVAGFKVFTKQKGEVGSIVGFTWNGAQDLLVVKTGWGEFEVPFVDAFVEKVDYEAKEMHLDLPRGLLGDLDDNSNDETKDDGSDDQTGDDGAED